MYNLWESYSILFCQLFQILDLILESSEAVCVCVIKVITSISCDAKILRNFIKYCKLGNVKYSKKEKQLSKKNKLKNYFSSLRRFTLHPENMRYSLYNLFEKQGNTVISAMSIHADIKINR